MAHHRTTPILLLLLATPACGAADDGPGAPSGPRGCSPGEAVACACSDGTGSVQVCAADGASLGPCACDGAVTTAPSGATASDEGPGIQGSTSPTDPTEPAPSATDPAAPVEPVDDASAGSATDPAVGSDPAEPTDPGVSSEPTEPVDPSNAPGVLVPGVACGSPLDSTTYLPPIVELGGRQVFIDYACGKPEGTPVTFILNLHGTMDLEEGKIYQRGYLPAYNYTASHDFVIATPKAITSQWGNGDGGQDLPHLLETIDWVYASFAAFDIQQMWVVGHSWGAMYARDFVCRAELADRISGVVLMSGGSGAPPCAERVSIIGTVGETDIVPGEVDQTAAAVGHGCGPATTFMIGNTSVTDFPSCSPGWVHRNYFMLGKGHGFDPADWPEQAMIDDLVDAIRSTR